MTIRFNRSGNILQVLENDQIIEKLNVHTDENGEIVELMGDENIIKILSLNIATIPTGLYFSAASISTELANLYLAQFSKQIDKTTLILQYMIRYKNWNKPFTAEQFAKVYADELQNLGFVTTQVEDSEFLDIYTEMTLDTNKQTITDHLIHLTPSFKTAMTKAEDKLWREVDISRHQHLRNEEMGKILISPPSIEEPLKNYYVVKKYWLKNKHSVKAWIDYAEETRKAVGIPEAFEIYQKALKNKVIKKQGLVTRFMAFAVNHLSFAQAESTCKQAMSMSNSDTATLTYTTWLIKNKQFTIAEPFLIDLKETYGTQRVYINLAQVYLETDRLEDAIELYEVLINKSESNGKAWKALRKAESLLNQQTKKADEQNRITKSISFAPEHQLAGLNILQNFGLLLKDKYPDGGVAFTIKQNDLKVTMIIDHPSGEKEVVEDYLNRYGLVVTGKIKPEEFTTDPLQVMDLKRQLFSLESELKWSNEKQRMLEGTIVSQDKQVSSLENQVQYFQLQLGAAFNAQKDTFSDLILLLKSKDTSVERLSEQLMNAVQTQNKQASQQIIQNLEKHDPTVKVKIKQFTEKTLAASGGNAPAWIDFISKLL